MPFSQYLAFSLLNWYRGTAMPAAPPVIYVSLHTIPPGPDGTQGDVTAAVAGSRGAISAADWASPLATQQGDTLFRGVSNIAEVLLTRSAIGSATVRYFGCWDAASGGNLLEYGALTSRLTILAGDPVRFLPGGLVISASATAAAPEEVVEEDAQPLVAIDPLVGDFFTPVGVYVLGWSFETNVAYKVGRVGVYASTSDNHKVGIWELGEPYWDGYEWVPSATLLWQGEFLAGQGELLGDFRWQDVDGPVLLDGTVYVVAATWGEEPVPAGLGPEQVSLLVNEVVISGPDTTWSTQPGAVPQLDVDLEDPSYAPIYVNPGYSLGFFTANLALEPAPE